MHINGVSERRRGCQIVQPHRYQSIFPEVPLLGITDLISCLGIIDFLTEPFAAQICPPCSPVDNHQSIEVRSPQSGNFHTANMDIMIESPTFSLKKSYSNVVQP